MLMVYIYGNFEELFVLGIKKILILVLFYTMKSE